jgi:phosphatidate cytidylyltransferase
MRDRAISSIGVVAVGLIPAFAGGPVFAAVFAVLMIVGFDEYRRMAGILGVEILSLASVLLLPFGIAALAGGREEALLASIAGAALLPVVLDLRGDGRPAPAAVQTWAFTTTGLSYLGIPLFAAVAIRETEGGIDAEWMSDLAGWLSPSWDASPRGLAWLLIVILATWFGDTGAYLVGRAIGRTPLLPAVSPKKTVEGSVGGLIGSMLAGGLGAVEFGLDVPWYLGAAFGLLLGVVGQVGDLCESLLKRQAGVKDSGTLIRGHGGVLDRVDALIFALVAGFATIPLVERWS